VGAAGRIVPPPGRGGGARALEQSADLRDYFSKHTKTDRLDAELLARLPVPGSGNVGG
jgi:hypothetical protein